jgi:hypothetical protein
MQGRCRNFPSWLQRSPLRLAAGSLLAVVLGGCAATASEPAAAPATAGGPPAGWQQSSLGTTARLTVERGGDVDLLRRTLGPPSTEHNRRGPSGDVRILEYAVPGRRVLPVAMPALPAVDDLVVVVGADGRIADLQYNPNRFNFDGPRTMMASASRIERVTIEPGAGQWVKLP